jgi:multidrug efflux pump subunit AcrB
MLDRLIAYCANKHLLMNFLFVAVIVGGVFAWQHTNKEELPDITFDRIRISVRYPGAPAEDVELFVTKPIEERIRGLDGVYRIKSTSSMGVSSISVEIEQGYPDFNEALTEVRNAVLDADLPDEVIDDPSVRAFKTSKKAILDIALIHKEHHILSFEGRRELQKFTFAFENRLLSLPEVNSISKRGYLQEELQIKVRPNDLLRYEIPFNMVMRQIRQNHVRRPAGTLKAAREPKVTLLSELDTPEKLRGLVIQGGFDGQMIRLDEIADVDSGYQDGGAVYKVNGHETVMLSVVKNGSYGILDALEAVRKTIRSFQDNNLAGTPIELVLLDDESIDLRNRLSIIGMNAAIGFTMIITCLFIFLNVRAGLWVAMGVPFTFCCTMICASLMGYTINGTTLAAVIIVMGMVVDDAIVVAENITRLLHQGVARAEAVVKGTSFVFLPIIASIATTCVAFVPLFFFSGHFGKFIGFIPPIIFLMLGASLVESLLILPGHMALHIPRLPGRREAGPSAADETESVHWFGRVENAYAWFLEKALSAKWLVLLIFVCLLAGTAVLAAKKFKFEMFPREETRDIILTGETQEGMTRYETAKAVRAIEDIVLECIGEEVVGVRTSIARSRRGGAVRENAFRMHIEIVTKEQRDKTADELVAELDSKIKACPGFADVKFAKSRWGQDSGSPIEIIVEQNNNALRHEILVRLAEELRKRSALTNVEIEEGLRVPEYRISIDRDMIKRLSIQSADVVSTFRASLEGIVLYEFSNGDEDVRVRLTTDDATKSDIGSILRLPVENSRDYLVSLSNIVTVAKVVSPNSITRRDMKRTALLYADIEEDMEVTPLEVAAELEANVFPKILAAYPTAGLSFGGEVQDTRESTTDFRNAVIMAILLIYIILAVLFDSLGKPLIVMLAIPFGMVGIILAFYLHGKVVFGFFAAVGALGLSGVVVNDAIIMLVKLDREFAGRPFADIKARLARTASTRLRAVILTTITTVAGVLPTAYAFAGYDAMLADMMLALAWGISFGTCITLLLVPCVFGLLQEIKAKLMGGSQ